MIESAGILIRDAGVEERGGVWLKRELASVSVLLRGVMGVGVGDGELLVVSVSDSVAREEPHISHCSMEG